MDEFCKVLGGQCQGVSRPVCWRQPTIRWRGRIELDVSLNFTANFSNPDGFNQRAQELFLGAPVGGLELFGQPGGVGQDGLQGQRLGSLFGFRLTGQLLDFLFYILPALLLLGQAGQQGLAMAMLGNGGDEALDGIGDGSQGGFQLFGLRLERSDVRLALTVELCIDGGEQASIAEEGSGFLQDDLFYFLFGDGLGLARLVADGEGIGGVGATVEEELAGGAAAQTPAADLAVNQTGEQERGAGGAGVNVLIVELLVYVLDLAPGFLIDQRLAVVFDDVTVVAERSDVNGMAEHAAIAGEAIEQPGFFIDLGDGVALGAHLEGAADAGGGFGIGDEDGDGVIGAITTETDDLFDFLIAHGGETGDVGMMMGDDKLHAALDIAAKILAEFCVFPGDDGFEQATLQALGDGIVDGEDEEATAAQLGQVVHGVVVVTGEAGVIPEQEAFFLAGGGGEMLDHLEEGVAAGGFSAGTGGVFEEAGEDVAIGFAPLAGSLALLEDGKLLVTTAGITQVGG